MPKLKEINLKANKLIHIDDSRGIYNKSIGLWNNPGPGHYGETLLWMGEEDHKYKLELKCATPICLHDRAIADMNKLDVESYTIYSIQFIHIP